MAPIVLTGLLTMGTVLIAPLNFNIIALPLLFGIGVAFHIYFVMSWRPRTSHRASPRGILQRARDSDRLAVSTSSHPGTASMGKLLMSISV